MDSTEASWWRRVQRSVITVPLDIVASAGYAAIATATFLVARPESIAFRSLIGVPLLLFVPGYTIVAALFPCEGADAGPFDLKPKSIATADAFVAGVDVPARLALSFGTSLTILPIVGLALSVTGLGLGLAQLLGVLVFVVGTTSIVAWIRRLDVPSSERFDLHVWSVRKLVSRSLFNQSTGLDKVLTIGLVLAVIVATMALTLGLTVPNRGQQFTEVTLFTETETGSLEMANYSRNLTAGGSPEMVLGLLNREGKPVEYTAVVQIQRVREEDNTTKVVQRRTVNQFSETVDAGSRWHERHTIEPAMIGDDLRLAYLVYKDAPPARPTQESAYRELYLWVNVTKLGGVTGRSGDRPDR